METPFKLILISPENDREDELELLNELFGIGLSTYHLRKPHWRIEEARLFLEKLPPEFHNRVALHSHFELSNEFGVKGIHLNEENKKLAAQPGKYKIISASFHSLEDLRTNDFQYEYVFLSPIFDSISKPGYGAKFDLDLLAENLQNKPLPKVIALGGVNAENISLLKPAGFSGAALLGAVWQSEYPVKAFLEIQSIIK